jgi:hypothetical protein
MYDNDNGDIYLPATPGDILRAWMDGSKAVVSKYGMYLPIEWFINDCPEEGWQEVESKIRDNMKRRL